MEPQPDSSTATYRVQRQGDAIQLSGALRMQDAPAVWRELRQAAAEASGRIVFELSRVEAADGGVVALLVALRDELAERGLQAELVGANQRIATVIGLYTAGGEQASGQPQRPEGFVAQLGRTAADAFAEVRALLDFLGALVTAGLVLIRKPRAGNWKDFFRLCERAGADALPIVLVINFLVGFVMAFQSAKQLKLYGANIYVSDLVGISLARELAPLMTAIIVCGRSGAAFAAEIGSMKVNEEIDALRTLGLMPFGWLVVPRAIALAFVVPLLTLIADFVGIAGGLVVGITDLDVSPQGYVNETLIAVKGWDVATGVIKSGAFSVAIALVACQQGLAASGGAEGVGKRTTSSVVTTLFTLVILDALFTVIFRALNI